MKNYLFFIPLIPILITMTSCTSNEELSPIEVAVYDHQSRIEQLETKVERLEHIFEEINTMKQTIDQLNRSLTGQNDQLRSFQNTLEQIRKEVDHGAIHLSEVAEELTHLDNEVKGFMEAHKIFYGDVSISSSEDYQLFVKRQYKAILGALIIHSTDLENLEGLESITSVGSLEINSNRFLKNTEGLNNLAIINGDFIIIGNTLLEEISPFKVKKINGFFGLRSNPLLKDLKGLQHITNIDGLFYLDYNHSLTNLDGLKNLSYVYSVIIARNNALINLDGLNNLARIESSLEINKNTNLSSFRGLQKLFKNGDFKGSYECLGNAFNPSKNDLETGKFSL